MCWLLAFAGGAALGYWLIVVSGQDRAQSVVLSIVTALLGGMVLRRVLCRPRKVRPGRVVPKADTPRGRRGRRQPADDPAAVASQPQGGEVAAAAATGLAAAAIRQEAAAETVQAGDEAAQMPVKPRRLSARGEDGQTPPAASGQE
ncbi:MAG: hypothetical protein D6811_11495, partial [Alphaproteobacteria bacterium]